MNVPNFLSKAFPYQDLHTPPLPPWTCSDKKYSRADRVNGEKIDQRFYEKELQKTNQEEFRIEKVIKRKGDKLDV